MKYILIGLILIGTIGCGSNGNKSSDGKETTKPKVPHTQNRDKQPPSIPNI